MTHRWRPARLPVRPALLLLFLATAWAGFLSWHHANGRASLLDRVEGTLADFRLALAGPAAAPPDVAIVAIDDATVAEDRYPLPRERLAELVSRIRDMRPKALAVDVLLVDKGEPATDAALARALGDVPHVLAAAGLFDRRTDQPRSALPATVDELWPDAAFFDPDAVGFVNVATDPSGSPRFFPLVFRTTRGVMPAFVLRAAALARGEDPVLDRQGLRFGSDRIPLDFGRHLPVRALGPAGTVPTVSAKDVLAGTVPPERLANRLVVLGVTATAVGDTFGTVFDPVVPGVEVLATGIASLAGGATLRRDAAVRAFDAGATVLAAAAGAVLLAFAPLLAGLIAAGAVFALWMGAAVILFGAGLWLAMALPIFGVLPGLALVVGARELAQRRSVARLARTEEEFRRFQPPAFAERLGTDPDFLEQPVEQAAAILFVDLAGFTRHAEKLGSNKVHHLLRSYHSLIETVAARHRGTVMNFMGDGAMILFGVPDPAPDDAARALAASFALRSGVEDWIAGMGAGLGVRLGTHYGPVTLSRLGHEAHQQITASGDNVNVAARLMEVAKDERAVVVVSQDLMEATGTEAKRDLPPSAGAIEVPIRGREGAKRVIVWR